MSKSIASSELIINQDGSVFHLHVKPELLADKVIVVGGLCWVLHHFAEGGNKAARWGLRICAAVYTALCIYHFYGLLMIGGMLC